MFRISSIPPRDQLFQPRDLVTSPPPGAPGTEAGDPGIEAGAPAKESRETEAVVVDLTPARSRQAAAEAITAANVEAAAKPGRDMKALAGMLRDAARSNPGQLVAAQGAPDARRVHDLIFGS